MSSSKTKRQKTDKAEKERRIRIVQEWLIDDWPSQDIVTQACRTWGIEWRQAKRYIAEARKRWSEEEDALLEHKRRLKIQSLKKLKKSLSAKWHGTPMGIRAVLDVEKEIIKLEGLTPPAKLELTGKNGGPILTETSLPDLSKLSTQELELLSNLYKKAKP